MTTKFKSQNLSEQSYISSDTTKKYTLDNPPSIDSAGFVIEYAFLRDLKVGQIPNLEQYLNKLNEHDWTCLLAHNPRQEFLDFLHKLDKKIISGMGWKYILTSIISANK